MNRFRLWIEYDGRAFVGWQRQDNGASVQGALERAAVALAGGPVTVHGAGRTDAGVHATRQAAHLDLDREITPEKLADALNAHLRPDPVAVTRAELVPATFHARFSATARHYVYVISNRRAPLTWRRGLAWRVPAPLDDAAMQVGAGHLIGQHDFSTFRDAQCQADSPLRTLDTIRVERRGEDIRITCSARAFLHRQVRSMVGSLVEVGRGRHPSGWMAQILAAADRSACGPVAPPDGLFLTGVDYPE